MLSLSSTLSSASPDALSQAGQFSFTRAINNTLTAGGVQTLMYALTNGTDFTDVIRNLTVPDWMIPIEV